MLVEYRNIALEIPVGWQYEADDDCLSLYNPVGVGATQISSHTREDREVSSQDLRDIAEVENLSPVEFPLASGFTAEMIEDGCYWRKWWLRESKLMVLVTYNCDAEDRDIERQDVEDILVTICISGA